MGYIYEGVLFKSAFEEAMKIGKSVSSNLSVKIGQINEVLFIICEVDPPRKKPLFSPDIEYIASQVSVQAAKALAIYYDDRVGVCCSILFEEGIPVKSFDEKDEVWVLLDENGEPIVDKEQFNIDQVEADEENEYDVICNAIQIGLNELKEGIWSEIHKFITTSKEWKNL